MTPPHKLSAAGPAAIAALPATHFLDTSSAVAREDGACTCKKMPVNHEAGEPCHTSSCIIAAQSFAYELGFFLKIPSQKPSKSGNFQSKRLALKSLCANANIEKFASNENERE
jgi:hypothetical protein